MTFTDTKLPLFLIADLYKNVLIESNEVVTPKVAEALPIKENSISFLGENKKRISIIINDAEAVFIGDEKLQLLTNLLIACKLTIADVAIVNTHNKSVHYTKIKQELHPSFLLLMGIDARTFQLPIIFPEYKIQSYDTCQILIADDLKNMLGTSTDVKLAKSKLWLCLKQMFLI
jgi:hypothetical protein